MNDKHFDQIIENKQREIDEIQARVAKAAEWGTSPTATSMSEIVLGMIQQNVGRKLTLKSKIVRNTSFIEAVEEACVVLGLSSDDFSPYLHDEGNEVGLSLWQ